MTELACAVAWLCTSVNNTTWWTSPFHLATTVNGFPQILNRHSGLSAGNTAGFTEMGTLDGADDIQNLLAQLGEGREAESSEIQGAVHLHILTLND